MKSFLKNYKQTLILLAAIIIGAIVGLCCAEKATVLSPLGDIIGLIIVPLIFLTISTSISKISQPEKNWQNTGYNCTCIHNYLFNIGFNRYVYSISI